MSAPGSIRTRTQTLALTLALALTLGMALFAPTAPIYAAKAAPPMVVVHEKDVVREEPPPHGEIGMSTAYRISDAVPARTMDFRKRTLHVGAAIGPHVIAHDEVYYVVDGEGEVTSDGTTKRVTPGMAAYLYNGANVGIRQVGKTPLTLIIAYPLPKADQKSSG